MMACRTFVVAAAAAVAVLIVDQVACATFVTPEVVVMRLKRSAEPMRSFSFSGFNPNGQMAAFTGAAEYPMFANYMPQQSQYSPYNYDGPQPQGSSYGPQQQATQDVYGPPQATQDSYGPAPSGVAEQQPTKKQQQPYGGDVNGQESGPKPSGAVPADSKEKIDNSAEQADDNNNNNNNNSNKKQFSYRGKEGPSSNAEASFNAWFPIMFGVFPNGAQGTGQQSGNGVPDRSNNNNNNNNNNSNNNNNRGPGQDQGNQQQQQGNGFERLGGTTVIANSVSNGRNGVATSHAIAYGNPRSSSK